VITIGQIVGMAAHLEGKGVTVLDMAAWRRKTARAVVRAHARDPALLHAPRIATAERRRSLDATPSPRSAPSGFENAAGRDPRGSQLQPDPDRRFHPQSGLALSGKRDRSGASPTIWVRGILDGRCTAARCGLLGDAIASNMFMLGTPGRKAWFRCRPNDRAGDRLERSRCSDEQAGFSVGPACGARSARRGADRCAEGVGTRSTPLSSTLEELIAHRVGHLRRTRTGPTRSATAPWWSGVRSTEKEKTGGTALTAAVARGYAKLLAYKDEYEVARLYSDPAFAQRMSEFSRTAIG